MADEETEKPEAGSEEDKGAKKSGIMGPALGIVAVLLIGAGLGSFISGMLKDSPDPEEGGDKTEVDAGILTEKELWDKTESIVFDGNIANVSGEQNRYVKCTVDIRVLRDTHLILIDKEPVKNLLREQILVQLRSYNKADLEGPHIVQNIQIGLRDKMNRELRKILDPGTDTDFIQRVIVSSLMKQ